MQKCDACLARTFAAGLKNMVSFISFFDIMVE